MKRPCKFCSKMKEEHEDWHEEINFFCPGQMDLPPEIMDYYEPCDNLRYLEYLDKKGI